jgi:hypothetical protein
MVVEAAKTNLPKTDGAAISQESVPFSYDELFFSRTDEKGIIISGNTVFQRISDVSLGRSYWQAAQYNPSP